MEQIIAAIQTEPVWAILIAVYLIAAGGSFIPVLRAYRAPLPEVVASNNEKQIDESPDMDEYMKRRLKLHYQRIQGPLKVWRKMAEQNKKLHQYSLFWLTLSAPLVPIITQGIDGSISKLFLTIVSLHAAVMLSFQRVLKPDQAFQAYRQSESDFYDLYRRMLDNPRSFDPETGSRDTILANYYKDVEKVRAAARQREIREYFPTFNVEQVAQQFDGTRQHNTANSQNNLQVNNAQPLGPSGGQQPTVSTPVIQTSAPVYVLPNAQGAAPTPQGETPNPADVVTGSGTVSSAPYSDPNTPPNDSNNGGATTPPQSGGMG